MVMEDPTIVTQFGDSADPLADYLKNTWGIILGNDIILDQTSNSPYFAVASQYRTHLITQKLQGMVTVFPYARSVSTTTVQGVTPTTLITTGQASWAETNLAGLQNNRFLRPSLVKISLVLSPLQLPQKIQAKVRALSSSAIQLSQSTVIMLPMETVIF